ncbi:winged helix-turn-helix domain-containing protein [Kribbella sp. NPDC006257]|uniref:winged helix-turn-helix domain-containing protein n=1 Tax=Kribbella sp. NPDC006257 TaxID=3156738 RepID=UPI0033ACC3C3
MWDDSSSPAPAGVAGVLGRSRAELLTQLDGPRSTTERAGRTGLTPGGVSQHLSALRADGLVTAHRAGRAVLYARTSVAEALLEAAKFS